MRRRVRENEVWAMYDEGLDSLQKADRDQLPALRDYYLARANTYALFAIALRLKLIHDDLPSDMQAL